MDWHTFWKAILNYPFALLIGGITGGLAGAIVTWWTWRIERRENTARLLLSEGLAVHALQEAWILDGQDYRVEKISENKKLPTKGVGTEGLWLLPVEVRAVLDMAKWNAPQHHFYGFLDGRRTWIVRDQILELPPSYSLTTSEGDDPHPGLLSSRGMYELCGWIERVASARSGWTLSRHGLKMLWPLLISVAAADRIEAFRDRLTPRAQKFLLQYGRKYKDGVQR